MKTVKLIEGSYEAIIAAYEEKVQCRYFEFSLVYMENSAVFTELDRFLWESRHIMTRFKNTYTGPVLIDLSAYNDKNVYEIGEYFHAFMYFLQAHEQYDCTMSVEGECSEALREALEKHFKMDILRLEDMPATGDDRRIGFDGSGRE